MTIKKALDHFAWKFKNKWSATETDVKAYNSIIEFVNQKHKGDYNNNQLFAKMYIKYFGKLLQYHQTSVLNNEIQKEIHKVLSTEINTLISEFKDIANFAALVEEFNQYNINQKHPATLSPEEKKKELKVFETKIKPYKMDLTECQENLKIMINLAINQYGSY